MEREEENKVSEEQLLEQIRQMEAVVKPFLTAEALQRLNNLKVAHQDKWLKTITLLYQLISSGQIRGKIDDTLLKKILSRIIGTKRRETRIRFIHR